MVVSERILRPSFSLLVLNRLKAYILSSIFTEKVVVKLLIYDALRNLVPFAQFEKREKHPWRSVTFSKVAG